MSLAVGEKGGPIGSKMTTFMLVTKMYVTNKGGGVNEVGPMTMWMLS